MSASPGAFLRPDAVLAFLSPDEWEEFVLEWAHGLEADYTRIKRLGGPGDQGIDVAAFLSDAGLDGPWHCFQCKHYNRPLERNDAWPELYKIFDGAVRGIYTLPQKYIFLAPRGCGRTLDRLLSSPSKLKEEFLAKMADDTYPLSGASRKSREAVASLVETSDLGFVDSAPIHDVLEVHSRTRYHSQRFSTPLADRPPCEPPPSEIDEGELRYVSQLVEVYNEHFKGIGVHVGNVAHASKCATHFQRQRESFYAAEALRRFARDQVPPGTYEHLQENIYQGVVETAEMPHADGYVRLQTVLQLSMSIDVSSNRLMQVLDKADCKGICHQLANEDRLRWVTQDD